LTIVFALLVAGCGLRPSERLRIQMGEAEAARLGHPEVRYVEYVEPRTAVKLGFLPFGVAGFYVHRPGLAVSGFLWPLSIAWVPAMAYGTAEDYDLREFRNSLDLVRQQAGVTNSVESTPPRR
jgi:hypothetical protein